MDKSIFETDEINKLALKNFGKFVKVIRELLVDKRSLRAIALKNIKFDLIIGAADSGIGVLKFTELIYEQLELPLPKTIQIPIIRFKDPKMLWADSDVFYFDSSALLPEVKEELKNTERVQNILFVDDEISIKGSTFLTCLKLVSDALGDRIRYPLNCYIVAEDHQFKVKNFDPNIKVHFFPFSKGIHEVYSVISYIVPWEIEKQIKEHFSEEELNSKRRLNLLLGLPAKERINNKGEFVYKYRDLANERIENFKELQEQFRAYLEQLIKDSLNKEKFLK